MIETGYKSLTVAAKGEIQSVKQTRKPENTVT